MMKERKKILAASSLRGHWVQLLRITSGLEEEFEVVYMSTHARCATLVEGHAFYRIPDFSRWDAWKVIPAFFTALRLVRHIKPDAVITTGAAPGLVVLCAASLCRRRTVWVDSIANVNHISLCGRIAKPFASRLYTQWGELEGKGVYFAGNVIG